MWRETYEPIGTRARRRLAARAAALGVLIAAGGTAGMASRPDVWGFYAPWDRRSAASVIAHSAQMAVVVSGWIALDSTDGTPALRYPDTLQVPSPTRRFALVTTYARDRFHPELIPRLATDPARLATVAGSLASLAADHGYRGLVLDFEGLTVTDTTALSAVLQVIVDSAHRRGIAPVTVAVAPADSSAYAPRVLRAADLLLVMLYDQHWATSTPGSIGAPEWVAPLLAWWVDGAGAKRLVAGLPAYGYAWRPGASPATVISYGDAVTFADAHHVPLVRDTVSQTLRAVLPDSADLWVSDAPLLAALVGVVEQAGVRHIALWRLGLEDPAFWRGAP